ncbi:hypothetical protein K8I85_17805 [bacterium]|nr:hypothetical protein [bacterium]
MFRNTMCIATVLAVALLTSACSEDPASPSADGESIADIIASASFDGTPGELQADGIPRPGGGPSVSVAGNATVVNGGTATLTVTSPDPFRKVLIAGSAPISGLFAAVNGFYEVALPISVTSADVLLTFPQALPSGPFDIFVSAADAGGAMGPMRKYTFNALAVGTGDVQVTVNWDTDADVDLHVVDPSAQEIYWASRTSASGGELDLDSNAACNGDGVSNENITWGVGAAPNGTYTVRVDYWSACQASETNYTVLINNGGDVSISHGTFTGPGDNGGAGSGVLIGTFTFTGN